MIKIMIMLRFQKVALSSLDFSKQEFRKKKKCFILFALVISTCCSFRIFFTIYDIQFQRRSMDNNNIACLCII